MPTPPTFDYDYLKKLVTDNPGASWVEIARMISEHEGRIISPGTLSSAYDRHRDAWGNPRRTRRGGSANTGPYRNVPPQYWNDTLIRHTRTMVRIARGQKDELEHYTYSAAITQAKKLAESRCIIDIRASGKPYIRPCRADELDSKGNLAFLISPHPGLTHGAWEVMTPREREMASMPWRPPGSPPLPTPADLGLDGADEQRGPPSLEHPEEPAIEAYFKDIPNLTAEDKQKLAGLVRMLQGNKSVTETEAGNTQSG